MRPQGGSFVTISSTAALVSAPNQTAYATTKSAVTALTRQVAIDYGKRGIRANSLVLGLIETAATRRMLAETPIGEVVRAATAGAVPTSSDVAEAVAFLAQAKGFNGASTVLDGGQLALSHVPDLSI